MTDSINDPPDFLGIITRGCHFTPTGCKAISIMVAGDGIITEREPSNPYDINAIKVITEDAIWFGYIGREYAAEIAPWMDRGVFYQGAVTNIMGCYPIVDLYALRSKQQETETERELELTR